MKNGWKVAIGSAGISLALMAGPITISASDSNENVHVNLNGIEVNSNANQIIDDIVFTDVKAYTTLLSESYQWDPDQKTVTVRGKNIEAVVKDDVVLASVQELANATGAEKVIWDEDNLTTNVLDLPEGAVQITPSVPGMGEHWANPNNMPVGPIYGVNNGKLIFIEQMLKQEDFASGKSFENIPGMQGLPSLSVDHTDIEFQPNGHEGLEDAHYDLHNYFVSHEEHQNIGKQFLQMEEIKQELKKYNTVRSAEAAGYVKLTDFVPQMGYHYMNPNAVGTDMPNTLLYAPVNGRLTLVAAEWGTPDPEAKSPIDDTSFGLVHKASAHYTDGTELEIADPNDAPRTNPETGASFEEWHPALYGMHLWFIDNPDGPFADMNSALESTMLTYDDFKANQNWSDDMLWAIQQGLIKGYVNQKNPNTGQTGNWLNPNENLTEAQMLSVLFSYTNPAELLTTEADDFWASVPYQLATKYEVQNTGTASAPVTRGDFAQALATLHFGKQVSLDKAVSFMYQSDLSNGYADDDGNYPKTFASFGVDNTLKRNQIATFLKRYDDFVKNAQK
ncbi:S-layer homology domain-containing protein [Aquibacillus salsiterrae]|uniref:S-layer homology domain-containing protein n=1 Tax=Aquibacillus salsiterrae TaxID=2950439 RepID=A0A9X4AFS5_9BACI|nr:S-layer homology domain-containing protein [Aquibacillus salsiterrae]MDC3418327.1 S-layer homology domain-containing protein [Aquibacillus salsiterrae]